MAHKRRTNRKQESNRISDSDLGGTAYTSRIGALVARHSLCTNQHHFRSTCRCSEHSPRCSTRGKRGYNACKPIEIHATSMRFTSRAASTTSPSSHQSTAMKVGRFPWSWMHSSARSTMKSTSLASAERVGSERPA